MKLASEAQIRAALESSLERVNVFRFPNVVGLPATHGVILDFVRKLQLNEGTLDVLGNGTQRKPYMHVSELVEAILFVREHSKESYSLYNMGPEDEGVLVSAIAEEVRNQFCPNASIAFGKEDFGWVGDVPRFSYSTAKLAKLGWRPQYSSMNAIQRAVAEVVGQEAAVKQAVILAGGKGTRLADRLGGLPKPLIDVDGIPLLQRQIELLKDQGFRNVLVLVNHRAELIEQFLAEQQRFGIDITCIDDGEPRGTAGAVHAVIGMLQPEFLVVYGDTLFDVDLNRLWENHIGSGAGSDASASSERSSARL